MFVYTTLTRHYTRNNIQNHQKQLNKHEKHESTHQLSTKHIKNMILNVYMHVISKT